MSLQWRFPSFESITATSTLSSGFQSRSVHTRLVEGFTMGTMWPYVARSPLYTKFNLTLRVFTAVFLEGDNVLAF